MIGHFSQIATKLADIAKNKKNGNPPGLSYILTKILENRCYHKAFENIIFQGEKTSKSQEGERFTGQFILAFLDVGKQTEDYSCDILAV